MQLEHVVVGSIPIFPTKSNLEYIKFPVTLRDVAKWLGNCIKHNHMWVQLPPNYLVGKYGPVFKRTNIGDHSP